MGSSHYEAAHPHGAAHQDILRRGPWHTSWDAGRGGKGLHRWAGRLKVVRVNVERMFQLTLRMELSVRRGLNETSMLDHEAMPRSLSWQVLGVFLQPPA